MAMAPRTPAPSHCAATRWSRDDLVAALAQGRTWTRSRSRLWRLLDAADLKPHRRVYGLNSPDPDCEAKAHALCAFSLNAHRCFAQGRVVICTDAKTGMQSLQRQYPTQPLAPGKPEQCAPEDSRHGVRALIASCVVPTGQVVWHLGPTRTRTDFATPLANGVPHLPDMQRYDGVVDHLKTPWSLAVCRLVAQWCPRPFVAQPRRCGVQRRAFLRDPAPKPVFHFPPTQGAWLNQVE
jgi:hypothetical protein